MTERASPASGPVLGLRAPARRFRDGGTRIHAWVYPLAIFQERMGLTGGERGADDALVRQIFARAGAYVMGRRMFDEGEVSWPEEAPFRAPDFVVTHHAREPWVRRGGTTFTFVTDGFDEALRRARDAAGGSADEPRSGTRGAGGAAPSCPPCARIRAQVPAVPAAARPARAPLPGH